MNADPNRTHLHSVCTFFVKMKAFETETGSFPSFRELISRTLNGLLVLASCFGAPGVVAQIVTTPSQSIVIEGDQGWRFLAVPSESALVSDLADDNHIQGVSGYFPGAATTLYVYYGGINEGESAGFSPASGPSQALVPGQGFIWYIYDECIGAPSPPCTPPPFAIDVPDDPPSGPVGPIALTPFNDESMAGLDHDGWHLLGNPYSVPLDVSNIASWVQGGELMHSEVLLMEDYPDGALSNASGDVSGATFDHLVPPWTAFWVRNDTATGITIPAPGTQVSLYRIAGATNPATVTDRLPLARPPTIPAPTQ